MGAVVDFEETIIFADEDDLEAKALQPNLKAHGYRLLHYSTREEFRNNKALNGAPCVLLLGDIAGVGFVRELRKSGWDMPIIVLHSNCTIHEAVRAIKAGADDYLPKATPHPELLHTIEVLMQKARALVEISRAKHLLLRKVESLSKREREIIDLVLTGMLNKEIADQLKLALVTVKVHRGHAMRKLGARTAGDLARLARELGLIPSSH